MGLQLSGSVQLEGNLLVTGSVNSVFQNVLVSGRLTAQEIETQLVSSSIIYSSGSNKFGDLITDKQQFTGSINLSGSLSVSGVTNIGTRSGGNIRNLNIYGVTDGNAIIKIDGADGNGYGAQIDFISKQTSGTSNTWTLGTGINSGTNAFELYNGSSTPLSINLSGSVGLGVSPSSRLHVKGTGSDGLTLERSAAGQDVFIKFQNENSVDVWQQLVTGTAQDFSITRLGGSGNILLAATGGNVGIGSGSISADVIDAGLGMAIVTSTGRTGLTLGSNQTSANEVLGRLSFTNTNSTNIGNKRLAYISGVRGATNNSAYLEFGTANDGLGSTKMVLNVSGSLGLGTTTPIGKIHIVADDVLGATDLQTAYDYSKFRLEPQNGSSMGLSIGYAGANLTYIQTVYSNGTAAPLRINPFGGNIRTGGNLEFTSGQGIDFSADGNAGGMTSELLDDYEEGTFTPAIFYNGTNTPTHTGGGQLGRYTKIGRVVHAQIYLNWDENGSTGTASITGLPFTSFTGTNRAVPSILTFGLTGLPTSVSITGYVESNSTGIVLVLNDNAGTAFSATYTDNDQDLYLTVTYQTT